MEIVHIYSVVLVYDGNIKKNDQQMKGGRTCSIGIPKLQWGGFKPLAMEITAHVFVSVQQWCRNRLSTTLWLPIAIRG
jgi:hypothetical protein